MLHSTVLGWGSPHGREAASPPPVRCTTFKKSSLTQISCSYRPNPAVHTLVLVVTVTLSHASCGFHFSERPQFALFRGRYFLLSVDFSFFCWIFHFFRVRFSQFRHFPDEERRHTRTARARLISSTSEIKELAVLSMVGSTHFGSQLFASGLILNAFGHVFAGDVILTSGQISGWTSVTQFDASRGQLRSSSTSRILELRVHGLGKH